MKILSAIILILSCFIAVNVSAMQITIYNKGASSKVEFTSAQEKKILNIVKELYEKTDKINNLNVDKKNITEIKSKDRCVEIIFDMSYLFNNSAIGNSVLNKILIPLSGTYAGDIKKGGLNFFGGLDDYNGKQYFNSNGMKYAEQIYQELLK
ncbi:MAG: hypothetical protein JST55_13195 [Bacteroidetes bacterium]|nr:hypothetical protein [Bacteroidota bacterium]